MDRYQKYTIHSDIEISTNFTKRWQDFLNIIADFVEVPSALIMKVHSDKIEVFSMNNNDESSPYKVGETGQLDSGLYCENVMSNRTKLLVPNALADEKWCKNPDVPLGMISYLGFPLQWPSGKIFGTICLLDKKENPYSAKVEKLLHAFSQHIESDLDRIYKTQELEEVNSNLREYVSRVCHDIRDPLGSIVSFADLMVEDFTEKSEDYKYAKMIQQISSNLIGLSQSLLQFSLTNEISLVPTDISKIVEEVSTSLQIEKKSLSIGNFPPIDTDPNLLYQLFTILISNSMKYQHLDRVLRLDISEEENSNDKMLLISIKDNGIGIAPQFLNQVFQPFFRGTHRDISGHGIGLATVKKIVDIHQGRVWAESSGAEGTTILVELPYCLTV